MAKKNFDVQNQDKIDLGKLIANLRKEKNISLRQLAKAIEIPPSNVTYIEKGVNSPSAETYSKIVSVLTPTDDIHKKMDELYSKIRKTPPPDVCEVILQTPELGEIIRNLGEIRLSAGRIEQIGTLIATFKTE